MTVLALQGAQAETVPQLVAKLQSGNDNHRFEAAEALVSKGPAARSAVAAAWAKAAAERKPLMEEVMLRIDGGNPPAEATFGRVEVQPREPSGAQEEGPDGKPALKIKAQIQATNQMDEATVLTIAKATIVTLKGKKDLAMKGPDGKPYERAVDARLSKLIEFVAPLPLSTYAPGTRAILVFEVTVGKDPKKQAIRSGAFVIEKQP